MTKLKLARLEGQSSDGKPLKYAGGDTPVGAEYTELDTGRRYKFDGQKWNELSRSSESKNFFSKQPRSSLIQLFGDEFAKVEASAIYTLEDVTDKQGGTSLTKNGNIDTVISDKLPLRGYKVKRFVNANFAEFELPTEAKVEVGTNSFIFKIDFLSPSSTIGNAGGIISYGTRALNEQGYHLYFSAANSLIFEIDDGTTAALTQDTSGERWRDDKWHTCVCFADRTNDTLKIFVDGILLQSVSIASVTGTLNNVGESFWIGARSDTSGDAQAWYEGDLSNFQLYQDADPNNLFNLIPILSNPQLRESAESGTFSVPAPGSAKRLVNQWGMNAASNDGDYTTTIINTSEGIYDLIELHGTDTNEAISNIQIDGTTVLSSDHYSASLAHNVTDSATGIYISEGSHILKIKINGRNVSNTTGWRLNNQMIELIKRDGEYNESDEATSGILFGDEIIQRANKKTDGTEFILDNDTAMVYGNEVGHLSTATADDGDYMEGDIFIKKGLYKITYTYRTNTTHGDIDLFFGGTKVLDKLDTSAAASDNNQETRFAFLEGGKTTVRVAVNGNAGGGTDFLIRFSAIRFELVDGKGNGDIVNIISGDADIMETVAGNDLVMGINTNFRFNARLAQVSLAAANDADHWLTRRYFSGGTYLVTYLYNKSANSPIMDIYTDDNSASPDLWDGLDMYNASTQQNLLAHTVVNLSRGFHDIHFLVNGKNASSGDYQTTIKRFTFTKIGENPDPVNDDNSDGVHGSIVPLAYHRAKQTGSSHTFDFAPIESNEYSEIIIEWGLEASASFALELKLNAIVTGYYADGNSNLVGTTANIDDSNTAQWIIASTNVVDAASREAYGKVTLFLRNGGNLNWIMGNAYSISATRGTEDRGIHTNVGGTANIDSIIIETSTSTWTVDTVLRIYGVKGKRLTE